MGREKAGGGAGGECVLQDEPEHGVEGNARAGLQWWQIAAARGGSGSGSGIGEGGSGSGSGEGGGAATSHLTKELCWSVAALCAAILSKAARREMRGRAYAKRAAERSQSKRRGVHASELSEARRVMKQCLRFLTLYGSLFK